MPVKHYTVPAITLHWLIALLIFAALPLGVYMHDLPLSPFKLQLYSYHKWIGVTVFLLAMLRMAWRVRHTPPSLPENMPQWEKSVSHLTHGAFYGLMLAVPLSGWLMSSAKGFQTVWLGLVPLPDLVGKDKELGKLLTEVHEWLNLVLAVLVAIHIVAVIKHTVIDHDGILARMLPKGKAHE